MARVVLIALLFEAAIAAQSTHVCACPDGRRFAVGASMFGSGSARVVITGLRPEQPQCTDLLVVGQAIRLKTSFDRHPYLERESLRRGVIRNICSTKIRFIEAKKSYDFFADDGTAVTLTETDQRSATPVAAARPEPGPFSEDLTGKDLLRLMSSGEDPGRRPGNSAFDQEELKEGSYFIVRKRVKAQVAIDDTQFHSQSRASEVSIAAGSLGKIEKRAGSRSEPLWEVEVLPDSAPLPFWRMLQSVPSRFRPARALPGRVILASSQLVEINRFLDQFHVEQTFFGTREADDPSSARGHREPLEPPTMRLQEIFARRKLSLEQNIALAQRSGALAAIQSAALGLIFISKNAAPAPLVIDESRAAATPDLMRRQCFMKIDRIDPGTALAVTGADVRIFQPRNSGQVPPDYYAVDLELRLQSAAESKVPLVCRFPSAPIDAALLDGAEQILSRRFDIRKQP